MNFNTMKKQVKLLRSKQNFVEKIYKFKKDFSLGQIEDLREANSWLSESEKVFLKAFDRSVKIQWKHKNFVDDSVKSTLQTFYEVSFL